MKKDVSSGELATIIADARPINPRRKWFIGFSIFVLLGLIFWFFSRNDDHDTGPTYETQNLTRGNISLVVTATGNLAPTNQVTVGSELSGTVSDVFVDTNKSMAVFEEWMQKARPAGTHGPSGLRRPLHFKRVCRPVDGAFRLPSS